MKITFLAFMILLFSTNNCANQEQEHIQSMSYETYTRGSSTLYEISSERITITATGLNKYEISEKLTEADWRRLMTNLEGVEIANLNQLKAPSESRASDAAPHAILSLRKNDTIYKTNSFDHGNAPESIKPLVEAILRLAENVE